MAKPISSSSSSKGMYPTPPHTGSHSGQWSQPPPPLPHSQHPPYPGRSYHGYGHPPPPPSMYSSSHHHRYPPPPPHHHHHGHGPPRSPHPYYTSGRGRPHNHQPHHPHSRPPALLEVPTSSSPAAVCPPYKTQTHPALVTPQTPQGSPPVTHRPPSSHYASSPPRVSSSNVPSTPSSVPPVTHTPNSNQDLMASNSNVVTTKPPRPYTEYTMFYQLEREYILHRLLVDKDDPKAKEEQEEQSQVALFKDDPLMPQRYRTLPLRADWYISGKSKKPSKRKHRKTHGKIGFLELTRMIAARWGEVDDETRKYCKMMAAMELVKYKEDVESYNAYKARLEKMGEVPEDVKEKERKKRAKDKRKGKLSAAAGGNKLKEEDVKSERKPSSKPSSQEPRHGVDNDMEQFITSLVNNDTRERKRPYSPPPIPGIYREDSILHHPHYDAPWNAFVPGPREERRMLPPPPVMRHGPTVASSKVITPERSAKRRRLPVHRSAHPPAPRALPNSHSSTEAAAIANAGPVSPDEDELIRMTFSGIDEAEIAREFYMYPSHPGASSPGNAAAAPAAAAASPQGASLPGVHDAEHHPTNQTTEALYGPPIQSFDYWDALMDPPTSQH